MVLLLAASLSLAMLPGVVSQGFYIDWSVSLCSKSCIGDPPCGRKHYPWEELFPSLQSCCGEGLPWKESECLAGEGGAAYRPTPAPTTVGIPAISPAAAFLPTSLPREETSASEAPLRTITQGPTMMTSKQETLMPTILVTPFPTPSATRAPSMSSPSPSSELTRRNLPSKMPGANSPRGTPEPTPLSSFWYPSLWSPGCTFGPSWPRWMALDWNIREIKYLFETKVECCMTHECEDTNTPTVAPSVAPTKPLYWYPDLYQEGGNCVFGSPEGSGYGWMAFSWNAPKFLHDTKEECCTQHGCVTEVGVMFLASDNASAGQKLSPLHLVWALTVVLHVFWIH